MLSQGWLSMQRCLPGSRSRAQTTPAPDYHRRQSSLGSRHLKPDREHAAAATSRLDTQSLLSFRDAASALCTATSSPSAIQQGMILAACQQPAPPWQQAHEVEDEECVVCWVRGARCDLPAMRALVCVHSMRTAFP